jgi:hypothetical protein
MMIYQEKRNATVEISIEKISRRITTKSNGTPSAQKLPCPHEFLPGGNFEH